MPRRICPRCGSRNTAQTLRGMPAFTVELQEKLDKKEIVLGGCCITGDDPTHHCNRCKKDFGYPTADMECATTSFSFGLGGFFGGYYSLSVAKAKTGAIATYTPPFSVSDMQSIEKELSTEEWLEFIHGLYRCYIPDWKKRYVKSQCT